MCTSGVHEGAVLPWQGSFLLRQCSPSIKCVRSEISKTIADCAPRDRISASETTMAEVAAAEVPQAEKDELFCAYAGMILTDSGRDVIGLAVRKVVHDEAPTRPPFEQIANSSINFYILSM